MKQRNTHSDGQLASSLYDWISAMIAALVALAVLFTCFMRVVSVDGDSMVPTLLDGDRLMLLEAGGRYADGDIVAVSYTHLTLVAGGGGYSYGHIVLLDGFTLKPRIKRVIAGAGETVEITADGRVYRDGVQLSEPYIQGKTLLRDFDGPLQIPEGYLFVMGDNRAVSLDSRSAEVGLIPEKDVVGKVIRRRWPVPRIGLV